MAPNKTIPLNSASSFKVEAIMSVDERGQMVLPKEIRQRAGIKAGDKLAVVRVGGCNDDCCDGACSNVECICLIKADALTDMVKNMLGPLMSEAFAE